MLERFNDKEWVPASAMMIATLPILLKSRFQVNTDCLLVLGPGKSENDIRILKMAESSFKSMGLNVTCIGDGVRDLTPKDISVMINKIEKTPNKMLAYFDIHGGIRPSNEQHYLALSDKFKIKTTELFATLSQTGKPIDIISTACKGGQPAIYAQSLLPAGSSYISLTTEWDNTLLADLGRFYMGMRDSGLVAKKITAEQLVLFYLTKALKSPIPPTISNSAFTECLGNFYDDFCSTGFTAQQKEKIYKSLKPLMKKEEITAAISQIEKSHALFHNNFGPSYAVAYAASGKLLEESQFKKTLKRQIQDGLSHPHAKKVLQTVQRALPALGTAIGGSTLLVGSSQDLQNRREQSLQLDRSPMQASVCGMLGTTTKTVTEVAGYTGLTTAIVGEVLETGGLGALAATALWTGGAIAIDKSSRFSGDLVEKGCHKVFDYLQNTPETHRPSHFSLSTPLFSTESSLPSLFNGALPMSEKLDHLKPFEFKIDSSSFLSHSSLPKVTQGLALDIPSKIPGKGADYFSSSAFRLESENFSFRNNHVLFGQKNSSQRHDYFSTKKFQMESAKMAFGSSKLSF